MLSDPSITFRAPVEVKTALRHVTMLPERPNDMSKALREWTEERIVNEITLEMLRLRGFDHTFQYLLNGLHGSIAPAVESL